LCIIPIDSIDHVYCHMFCNMFFLVLRIHKLYSVQSRCTQRIINWQSIVSNGIFISRLSLIYISTLVIYFDVYYCWIQTSFFFHFKAANLDVEISQHMFERLKPFVNHLKERNTYCCICHFQMEEMRQSLNNMRVPTLVVHLDYECICQAICRQLATKGAP
jgi:hypothetical protein